MRSATRMEFLRRAERPAEVSLQLSVWRPALVIFFEPVQAVSRLALGEPGELLKLPRCEAAPAPLVVMTDRSEELDDPDGVSKKAFDGMGPGGLGPGGVGPGGVGSGGVGPGGVGALQVQPRSVPYH